MRFPGRLEMRRVPNQEQEAAAGVGQLVEALDRYCQDFESALLLFDCTHPIAEANRQQGEVISRWIFIAARDGAMTIFHFGKVLEALRSSMKDAPTLRENVAIDDIRQAWKDFLAAFPMYAKMRHAVAHSGELLAPQKEAAHALHAGEEKKVAFLMLPEGAVAQLNVSGNLMDRTYDATFEGEYITYSVSEETLGILRGVERKVFDAFRHFHEKAFGA